MKYPNDKISIIHDPKEVMDMLIKLQVPIYTTESKNAIIETAVTSDYIITVIYTVFDKCILIIGNNCTQKHIDFMKDSYVEYANIIDSSIKIADSIIKKTKAKYFDSSGQSYN